MDFLTVTEAAEQVKMKPGTVQSWCRDGRVRAQKFEGTWVIKQVDLDALMKEKDELRAKFNQSNEASATVREREKAGTMNRITADTLASAEKGMLLRRAKLRVMFPNSEPGMVYNYLLREIDRKAGPKQR